MRLLDRRGAFWVRGPRVEARREVLLTSGPPRVRNRYGWNPAASNEGRAPNVSCLVPGQCPSCAGRGQRRGAAFPHPPDRDALTRHHRLKRASSFPHWVSHVITVVHPLLHWAREWAGALDRRIVLCLSCASVPRCGDYLRSGGAGSVPFITSPVTEAQRVLS